MLINCSLRELEAFLTLAETLNYRRSAERLHRSQPAVSGVIRRLEAADLELGIPQKRGPSTTDAARPRSMGGRPGTRKPRGKSAVPRRM